MPATDADTTRWSGNQIVTVEEEKAHKRIFGTVNLEIDNPVSGALVEVFTQSKNEKKQHRIAACVTGEDGKFCFGFIKPGKYEVRISKDGGFNVTKVYVRVNPYGAESTDTEIDGSLTLGT